MWRALPPLLALALGAVACGGSTPPPNDPSGTPTPNSNATASPGFGDDPASNPQKTPPSEPEKESDQTR